MTTGEVTNWELARRLDDLAKDLKDDLLEIARRQDAYVLREVYAAERLADTARLAILESRVKDGEDQRRSMARWMVSAVIIPVVSVIVSVVLNIQGPS